MLKIARAYLDGCGFRDGVFEELSLKALDQTQHPVHHIVHAPNGVGKTTILALLFSIFEPDRRRFLRTEINRQHKLEHYFLPNRLGVVALELEKEASGDHAARHIIGQVFWPTPASKGDEGEPGQRRFFAFQCNRTLTLDTLPFRGLAPGEALRTLDDFTRWAREMRLQHAGNFFSTDSLTAWRRHLTAELALDLRVIEVQRRFCAAEGGIGAVFLDFRNEQQFLEKVFGFMIAPETAETVVQALATGLIKIRDLPRRKDQLRALSQLTEAFAPFAAAASALESAEAAHAQDLKRLGAYYARARREAAALEADVAVATTQLEEATQNFEDARRRERTLEAEILFLEKVAAERRVEDAKAALELARTAREAADRRTRTAKAALVARRLASAEHSAVELEEELKRIERDLAPDRMRLERAGAALHGHLERLAVEAERDAQASAATAEAAQAEAEAHDSAAQTASHQQYALDAEIKILQARIAEHARERRQLESASALLPNELPDAATARLNAELAAREDVLAELDLKDEGLQSEATRLEGTRRASAVEVDAAKKDSERLAALIRAGEALEAKILDNAWLSIVLAGEAKDLYRLDLSGRVRAARSAREEVHRRLTGERDSLAAELAFLDAQGVSSVPEDVTEVTRVLRESGFSDAQAAEHYLAAFKPDAAAALELVCRDPARLTGVFVSNADPTALAAVAAERRLRLKGPVVVSQATLDAGPSSTSAASGFVFRPFSAARFNKDAAAAERHELAAALEAKEGELGTSRAQLETLQALVEDLRQLQERYAPRRPQELRQDRDTLDQRVIELERQSALTAERAQGIETERRQIKAARRIAESAVNDVKRSLRDVDQYAVRYASIATDLARLPAATRERDQRESEAVDARAAAAAARRIESDARQHAAELRIQSANFRGSKRHYPHTDGTTVETTDTLEDLIQQYRTADHTLMSRRDAQQAHVSQRLVDVRQDILTLREQSRTASANLTAQDIAPFASVVDLDRAITEAEQAFEQRREAFSGAEHAVKIAEAKSGPVIRMIREADEKRSVKPAVLNGFIGATAELCDAERDAREVQRRAAERDIRTFDTAKSRLAIQQSELQGSLDDLKAIATRIEDHLPEAHRAELPDLSMAVAEIKNAVGQLVRKLTTEAGKLTGLREECEKLFDAVRSVFLADAFRQLEPQVAENLRSYVMRSACADRVFLQTRLAERIAVVQTEIENQKRDQNACLEQLRQHVIHADDLLRRAMRCSQIPEHIPTFGGQRILKIKRILRDLSPDIVHHELNVWLDEQAISGRVPQDGALLAAELLNRVHGGRPLDIEILKPKRDAIQPYMRVDRMGLSGGEGVTVAMMLYAVIQRMAMDERASSKLSPSGGFLMLDNTYGMSNMLDHVVLQMAMADMLGIQLFVTTCSEDKHVLNRYPTITRLVQGEVVSSNGVKQYIRVRAADYVLKAPDAA